MNSILGKTKRGEIRTRKEEITTAVIPKKTAREQRKSSCGKGVVSEIKREEKIMDINDRFLLSSKQTVEIFGDSGEKPMVYKKIAYTQGLQYSFAWWAGGSVERYKKMPVCVSGLGSRQDREICIPNSYQNKWGNEVSVIRIRDKVFAGNPKIRSIILPSTIEKITSGTFSGCFSLERISLPKKITFIPQGAFRDCPNLKDVYYEGSEEEWEKITIVHKGIRVKSSQKLGLHCRMEEYEIAGNEPLLKARIHLLCKIQKGVVL